MPRIPNVQALFEELDALGIVAGVGERLRVQRVFDLEPQFTGENEDGVRLRSVLRAVFVKSEEQGRIFDDAFGIWLSEARENIESQWNPVASFSVAGPGEPSISPGGPAAHRASRPAQRKWPWVALALGLAFGIVLLVEMIWLTEPDEVRGISTDTVLLSVEELRSTRLSVQRPVSIRLEPLSWEFAGWGRLLVAAVALLAAAWILHRQRGRSWLPSPTPAPILAGPPRVMLPRAVAQGPRILDRDTEDALVWDIGRYVSEELSPRLDLPRTVAATAYGGGIPRLVFERHRFAREIWLWIDESADDPSLTIAADDIADSLTRSGVHVETALFHGVPELLYTANRRAFSPREVEERRNVALVIVLTDGRVLANRYRVPHQRLRIDAMLRELSGWPRLTIVDYSLRKNPAVAIFAQHDMRIVAPERLSSISVTSQAPDRRASEQADRMTDGEIMWAATCALPSGPVSINTALELRRALSLPVSPTSIRVLYAEAPGSPETLVWARTARAKHLSWLLHREHWSQGPVGPRTLLGRSLRFWEERYDAEIRRRDADHESAPWRGTPAQRRMSMERELLRLWHDPGRAIPALYAISGGDLGKGLRALMAELSSRGRAGPGIVELPWRYRDRTPLEQAMLHEMGLGGGIDRPVLAPPGRVRFAIAVAWAFCAAMLIGALAEGWRPPGGSSRFGDSEGKAAPLKSEFIMSDERGYLAVVVTPVYRTIEELRRPSVARVHWRTSKPVCVESSATNGDTEIWRCTRAGTAPKVQVPDKIWSVVVLRVAPSHRGPGFEDFVLDLLDSGTASLVVIEAPDASTSVDPPLSSAEQRIVLESDSRPRWQELSLSMRFGGTRPAKEVWKGQIPVGDEPFLVRGIASASS